MSVLGTVYLICFERPIGHAQHYLGWTGLESLDTRMEKHRRGNGSKLMAHVSGLGIKWKIVRTWTDVDRNFERRLKKRRNARELCPARKEKKRETANRKQRARRAEKRAGA
jgi:hypothetical protein